ncbi:MAG: CHRD domain-containing protein [Polyangia bacterium]
MRNSLLGMMLGLPLILAGCGDSGGSTIAVTMMAQMSSGQSGTAVLTDKGDSTQVVITTSGGSDSGAQAAHIHTGVCGSNGPILYPLNNVQGGSSTTTVNAKLSTLTGGKTYINVHSSTNVANIQSCGNIP